MEEGGRGGAEEDAGADSGRRVCRGEVESGAGPPHSKGCRTCCGPPQEGGPLPWRVAEPEGGEDSGRAVTCSGAEAPQGSDLCGIRVFDACVSLWSAAARRRFRVPRGRTSMEAVPPGRGGRA